MSDNNSTNANHSLNDLTAEEIAEATSAIQALHQRKADASRAEAIATLLARMAADDAHLAELGYRPAPAASVAGERKGGRRKGSSETRPDSTEPDAVALVDFLKSTWYPRTAKELAHAIGLTGPNAAANISKWRKGERIPPARRVLLAQLGVKFSPTMVEATATAFAEVTDLSALEVNEAGEVVL